MTKNSTTKNSATKNVIPPSQTPSTMKKKMDDSAKTMTSKNKKSSQTRVWVWTSVLLVVTGLLISVYIVVEFYTKPLEILAKKLDSYLDPYTGQSEQIALLQQQQQTFRQQIATLQQMLQNQQNQYRTTIEALQNQVQQVETNRPEKELQAVLQEQKQAQGKLLLVFSGQILYHTILQGLPYHNILHTHEALTHQHGITIPTAVLDAIRTHQYKGVKTFDQLHDQLRTLDLCKAESPLPKLAEASEPFASTPFGDDLFSWSFWRVFFHKTFTDLVDIRSIRDNPSQNDDRSYRAVEACRSWQKEMLTAIAWGQPQKALTLLESTSSRQWHNRDLFTWQTLFRQSLHVRENLQELLHTLPPFVVE